jgi:hypothetical protein
MNILRMIDDAKWEVSGRKAGDLGGVDNASNARAPRHGLQTPIIKPCPAV